MKILLLGSVALPVPPPMQGGTERIAYYQALGLSQHGHQVTLVAAHGSKAMDSYTLVEIGGGDTVTGSQKTMESQKGAGGFAEGSRNLRKEAVYLSEIEQYILDHGREYDCIVNNMRAGESLFVPAAKAVGVHYTTVMHLPLFTELAQYFSDTHTKVITISNAQREGFPNVSYAGTVYNCVDPELLEAPLGVSNGYLLMMGSIAPHKNQKDGILAAKKAGKQIVLAGKIGNPAYWEQEIQPLVDGVSVVHKGEMGLSEKIALVSGADALLFPIVWPEPFGLVMIEAMALGVPVVAYNNGAVSEVVVDGKTGFVLNQAEGIDGMKKALDRIGTINRADCRKHVADHFTPERMADQLENAILAVTGRG